ncbi:MAG: hypothetical protein J0H83_17085 [Candidatus Melainabacteria bacterium]|nr:hypothetical protein [Candidatus Melainabacteria bacterium]
MTNKKNSSYLNWANLVGLYIWDSRSASYPKLTQRCPRYRTQPATNPWTYQKDKELIIDAFSKTMAPLLVDSNFFEKTNFKLLNFELNLTNYCWPRKVQLKAEKKTLIGRLDLHIEDILLPSELLSKFLIGCGIKIFLKVCESYNLDAEKAHSLVEQFPINFVNFSFNYTPPEVEICSREKNQKSPSLTDEELCFKPRDPFNWKLSTPFDLEKLRTVDPDTQTIVILAEEHEDTIASIANLAITAPKATVVFATTGLAPLDPKGLSIFKNISRLALDGYYSARALDQLPKHLIKLEVVDVESLKAVAHLDNLESLKITGNFDDLNHLKPIRSLRALKIDQSLIASLEALKDFPKLQSLSLHQNKINSLNDLTTLTNLKFLELSNMPNLSNIDFIQSLHNLEFLQLNQLENIKSLPSLTGLKKLKRISLCELEKLSDLSPLNEAPQLEHLILKMMQKIELRNLSTLKGHSSLNSFLTDNLQFEKVLNLSRTNAGRSFEFSS